MLTIERIREAITKVGKKYGIKNAYLFGSYARGEATESSDRIISIAFRKIIAHAYGTINSRVLWDIVKNDIPELRNFCASLI